MFLCDPVTPTAGARKANKHFKIGSKSTGSSHSAAPSGQIKNWKQKKSYLLRTLGSCRAEGLQKFHTCTVFRHRWSLWGVWAVGMDLSRAHLSLAKFSFPSLLCNPKCHSTPQNTSSRPQLHAVLGKQVINCLLNENELPKRKSDQPSGTKPPWYALLSAYQDSPKVLAAAKDMRCCFQLTRAPWPPSDLKFPLNESTGTYLFNPNI